MIVALLLAIYFARLRAAKYSDADVAEARDEVSTTTR
jgi:hypothetical protein